MRVRAIGIIVVLACLVGGVVIGGQVAEDTKIPLGAHLFIAPMDGFERYLAAALTKKKVPLVVAIDRDRADFEVTGASDGLKPGWTRSLFGSDDQASISVTNLTTHVVAFAYTVSHKGSKQSAAEACAKHLKAYIEGKK